MIILQELCTATMLGAAEIRLGWNTKGFKERRKTTNKENWRGRSGASPVGTHMRSTDTTEHASIC